MSKLNLDWVLDNFKNKEFTFFEIGLGDLQSCLSPELKKLIPNGNYYTFEAAEYWHGINEPYALEQGINYFKYAVCDRDGDILFNPSLFQNSETHKLSSSIYELSEGAQNSSINKIYGDPYIVKSIRLETFCNDNNIFPDFIHIDVEGAELKVFKNIGKYKPKCIWTETSGFSHYKTETNIEEFNSYLESIGYYLVCIEEENSLYCLKDFKITNYK
jgi:FkbM family methyltransferase